MYLAIRDGTVKPYRSEAEAAAGGAGNGLETAAEEWDAAGRAARVVNGEIVLGRTEAEKERERNACEHARIKREIAERDYRALKAFKLGEDLDSLYPGETDWYRASIERIHELEASPGLGEDPAPPEENPAGGDGE